MTALANNYKLTDDVDIYYAEQANLWVQTFIGNFIVSGGALAGTATPLTSSGTHVTVSAGSAIVGAVEYTLSSLNIDLSTEYATLTTGEGMFVYIYVTNTGAVAKLAGTKGSNSPSVAFFPPDFSGLPADCCLLGRVILNFGDTIVSAGDIKDLRVNSYGMEGILLHQKQLNLEKANEEEFHSVYMGHDDTVLAKVFRVFNGRYVTLAQGASNSHRISFQVPIQTKRNGKKFYLESIITSITVANATNKLSNMIMKGVPKSGTTATIQNFVISYTATGDYTGTFSGDKDTSSYSVLIIEYQLDVDGTAGGLVMPCPVVVGYWAD